MGAVSRGRRFVVESSYRRAMEQRIPVEFEYYFERWGRWYRHRAFPQPGEGLAVYVQDSTDSRKAEQVLRRSEQLAAAGRLAVSISHEINNPLEAVTNLLYLARMDEGLNGKSARSIDHRGQGVAAPIAHCGAKPEVLPPANFSDIHAHGRNSRVGAFLPRGTHQERRHPIGASI